MNKAIKYVICIIITALPWLFLFEVFPIPYYRLGTFWEVAIEILMLATLIITLIYLRKDRKQISNDERMINLILYILTFITAFLMAAILVIMGIASLL